MPDVLTISEVSAALGLTDRDHRKVRSLVRDGLLTPLRGMTRPLRFSRETVEAYLRGETVAVKVDRPRRAAGELEWLKGVPRRFKQGKGAK